MAADQTHPEGAHRPAALPLTADVNALAWGQFHLRGGWPRIWGFGLFYAVIVGSLIALAIVSGNATAAPLKFLLTGIQAGILVLFVGGRVSAAVRQDLNNRMIESHRLMPMSPAQAVLGYLVGAAAHPLALAAANVALGLFVSSVGGMPASLWLTANAVLLEFGLFVAVALQLGAFVGKGGAAAGWVGFFVGIYSHAFIGLLLPALSVIVSPLAGHSVFNLSATGGEAAAYYAPPAMFHLWFGGVFFAGACRRYRRDDRPALGTGLGLALMAAWVTASAFGILEWDEYHPAMLGRETGDAGVQFLGSLGAAMLLAIVPLNGAAFASADWAGRRALGDPSLGRRPAPPVLVALVAAAVALALAVVQLTDPHAFKLHGPEGQTLATGALVRTAVVLASFFAATVYVLRVLYRRPTAPRFSMVALWVFVSWLLPMAVDTARWYMSEPRTDVLQTAASFSPLGSLIQVWNGRANVTTAGLVFQVIVAATLVAVFHLTERPRTPAPAPGRT